MGQIHQCFYIAFNKIQRRNLSKLFHVAIFIEKHNSSTIDILTMFQPSIPLKTASSVQGKWFCKPLMSYVCDFGRNSRLSNQPYYYDQTDV